MPGPTTAYQTGIHSARPANGAGCILYDCTTHALIYRDDGTTWTTFATLGASGAIPGTPAVVLGTAAAAGSATSYVATDATIVAFDATVPATQAMGDSAAAGSAVVAARRDHKHAMPALGTTAAAIGTSAGGSAVTPSKSDHVHATGAGTPSTQAFGDSAATGTGPAAAMTDHKHAMPSSPLGLSLALTGATAATRYVGATASGAPASGTFLKGDFVIDQTGTVYICTTAGSPGTWAAPSGGGGGSLTVEEVDGSPTDSAVTKIVFPNSTLAIASHVATYTPAGGGGGNYTQLATFDLGADTADFDFTSISGSYRALEIYILGRGTKAAGFDTVLMQFNGSSSSIYNWYETSPQGGNTSTSPDTSIKVGDIAAASATAGYSGSLRISIPFYADSTFDKTAISGGHMHYTSAFYGWTSWGYWTSTAAITRVRLFPGGGNWLSGSHAALYGIS